VIDQKMIPPEVVEAALSAYNYVFGDCYTTEEQDIAIAIAAALNAWPKMTVDGETYKGVTDWHIHLPLKEYSDD